MTQPPWPRVTVANVAGPPGPTGPTGPQGDPGPGIAAGGAAGQVLTKASAADFATQWTTLPADTGWVSNVTAPWATWTGPDWGPGGYVTQARRIGNTVMLRISVRRLGANLVPSAAWDIARNPFLTITDVRFRPSVDHVGMFLSGSQLAGAYIQAADGVAAFETLNTTLSTNQDLLCTFTFFGQ